MSTEPVLLERDGAVAVLRLNRPQALNALSAALMLRLADHLDALEVDDTVGALVLTGDERAFAAGADIKEMQSRDYVDVYMENFLSARWERLAGCRKPVVAAVAGFALGGGCELAMMCDIVLAADNARFGQPEIKIGTIPGLGGTQRLTRAIGKAKAMDLVLTGRTMDALEAERAGLVSRVLPLADLHEQALATARTLAALSRPAVFMAKEAVNRAAETSLQEGLRFERRLFHATFATADQKEGMAAFVAKRPPRFRNR